MSVAWSLTLHIVPGPGREAVIDQGRFTSFLLDTLCKDPRLPTAQGSRSPLVSLEVKQFLSGSVVHTVALHPQHSNRLLSLSRLDLDLSKEIYNYYK